MSTFVMTYCTAECQRVALPLIAASVSAAWNQAFDIAERLVGGACGFGVSRVRA